MVLTAEGNGEKKNPEITYRLNDPLRENINLLVAIKRMGKKLSINFLGTLL